MRADSDLHSHFVPLSDTMLAENSLEGHQDFDEVYYTYCVVAFVCYYVFFLIFLTVSYQ